jgi:SAM-dependent methyltransferase
VRRSNFIKTLLLVAASTRVFSSNLVNAFAITGSNFRYIYTNSKLKNYFFGFLKNVFNLYPEQEFHKLIDDTTLKLTDDEHIYRQVQSGLHTISPMFSTFRYEMPSLVKQKDEMAKETLTLLTEGGTYNGYLEVGSSGRYLDYLKKKVKITGERYYADGKEPGYAVTEIIDRGQISIAAKYIPLASYKTRYADIIPRESLDLVTVYIGFHHCPLDLRTPFISSIRDTLRPGGKLILRDHDCDTDDQKTLVALAHDVFNLGTKESWEYNQHEIRNFYSLKFICDFVENLGFKFDKRTLFEEGDPTKNALMLFTKV